MFFIYENMRKFIKEVWPYILILFIVVIIKAFIVSPIRVNGPSMKDTLQDKDIMILDKVSYRFHDIKRFDIVVIHLDEEDIIKRVIALPGEKVEYKDNKLYINGKRVKEKFKHAETDDFDLSGFETKKVPKNSYFVLGDNRKESLDSRVIGYIPKSRIVGHATFTVLPFSRWGSKS